MEDSPEDQINRLIEARKLLPNASYFAFTATPKNKTLELFGIPDPQPDGKVKHHPCHSYTMKQAIQEGFIRNLLCHSDAVTAVTTSINKLTTTTIAPFGQVESATYRGKPSTPINSPSSIQFPKSSLFFHPKTKIRMTDPV